MGGGLLTQKAFVPGKFDAGTLLLRHMGYIIGLANEVLSIGKVV